jgi:hypothetical protein
MMARRLVRAQILLEAEQHQALQERARAGGKSLSEVVRLALKEHLEAQRLAEISRSVVALDNIDSEINEYLTKNGGKPLEFDVIAEIHQAREEQDDKNNRAIYYRS